MHLPSRQLVLFGKLRNVTEHFRQTVFKQGGQTDAGTGPPFRSSLALLCSPTPNSPESRQHSCLKQTDLKRHAPMHGPAVSVKLLLMEELHFADANHGFRCFQWEIFSLLEMVQFFPISSIRQRVLAFRPSAQDGVPPACAHRGLDSGAIKQMLSRRIHAKL